MNEFPKMLYGVGTGTVVDGVECAAKLVHSQDEQAEALADGWGFTLAAEPADPTDDAPPTRDELEAKATELGIKFDGRTGDKKLAALIADKLTA